MLWDYGSYFISPHTVPSSIRIHGCILPTVITPVVFFSHFFYIYELEFLEETFFFLLIDLFTKYLLVSLQTNGYLFYSMG